MNQEAVKSKIDELLLAYIEARGETEATQLLEQIISTHAAPLVQSIIQFKLNGSDSCRSGNRDEQEVADLCGEVIMRLVRALKECKAAPQDRSIANLRSYVAVMAYNASDEYLRQKYPRRYSLKNKIKYILTHQPTLSMWESTSQEVVGGFAKWQQANSQPLRGLRQRHNELEASLLNQFKGRALERVTLSEMLTGLLTFSGAPVEIDELVTLIAELTGVRDVPAQTDVIKLADHLSLATDPRATLDAVFDHRARLERVWKEVCKLPARQCAALLLNLKDEQGESAITLLPQLRIATIHQIAEVLEISAEAMAAIWNDLPLEDAVIGQRLGATRQQVINLRKCARERLARRLAAAAK